jgi:hypothetical protein
MNARRSALGQPVLNVVRSGRDYARAGGPPFIPALPKRALPIVSAAKDQWDHLEEPFVAHGVHIAIAVNPGTAFVGVSGRGSSNESADGDEKKHFFHDLSPD